MVDLYYAQPLDNGRFGSFQIYQYNNSFYSARTYSEIVTLSQMDEFTKNDDYNLYEVSTMMNEKLYVLEEDLINFINLVKTDEVLYFNTNNYDQNEINYQIELSNKSAVYFSIPFDKGWKITDQNNIEIPYYSVQGGFIGLVLEKGKYQLHFEFMPVGYKLGLLITLSSMIVLVLLKTVSELKSRKM